MTEINKNQSQEKNKDISKEEINTDIQNIHNKEIKNNKDLNIEDGEGDEYIEREEKQYYNIEEGVEGEEYNIEEGGGEGEYDDVELGEEGLNNIEQEGEEKHMEKNDYKIKSKNMGHCRTRRL